MSPIFPELPHTLGDYTLKRLLGQYEFSDLYMARQDVVERSVVLEVLPAEHSADQLEFFVGAARARVSANSPHVGQVFEAVNSDGYWHVVQELPAGISLGTLAAQGKRLTPDQVCSIIACAAELYQDCAAKGLAAGPLGMVSIYVTPGGETHFLSPVIAGNYNPEHRGLLMNALAAAVSPLLPARVMGSTRLRTLVSWLSQGFEGQMLEWAAIGSTARLIQEQLNQNALRPQTQIISPSVVAQKRTASRSRRKRLYATAWGAGALLLILLIGSLGRLLSPPPEQCYVPIKGTGENVRSQPVSIGAYASFLESFQAMSEQARRRLHEDMPEEVGNHTPLDWEAMYRAASEGERWHKRQLTLESPVTNVSYWDALAYARYTHARLPEADGLASVVHHSGSPLPEEWSCTRLPENPILPRGVLVIREQEGSHPLIETMLETRSANRGFRTTLP